MNIVGGLVNRIDDCVAGFVASSGSKGGYTGLENRVLVLSVLQIGSRAIVDGGNCKVD
jgi:hypothetical protein